MEKYTTFHGQFNTPVDKLIREYFPDYDYIGVMIDVGASLPIDMNNSYHFERNGWDTYCIEPNLAIIPGLQAVRKNVLNYAVSNFDKNNVDFEVITLWGNNMGACSALRVDPRLEEQHKHMIENKHKIPIRVRQLNTLIDDQIQINKVDVLSIDTEGTELDVLQGFDITRWMPKLIICENNYDTNECRDYLKGFGYKLDKRSDINDFFIKD